MQNYTEILKENLIKHGIELIGEIRTNIKIVVPLSGGKDSQCCLMMALREYAPENILALFCDTGYEHPITYDHINTITNKYNISLVTLRAGTVESICMKYKRLPGGGARHCTDELKIRPSKYFYKYFAEINGGYEVWCGMRSDESSARAERYRGKLSEDIYPPNDVLKTYPKYLTKLGVMFRLPILDWETSEVFEILNGEQNALYKKGFDRVGCFPCLAGGEEMQMKAFYFDEVGKKHFNIANNIAKSIGRDVLTSKKFAGQGPGCSFCMF